MKRAVSILLSLTLLLTFLPGCKQSDAEQDSIVPLSETKTEDIPAAWELVSCVEVSSGRDDELETECLFVDSDIESLVAYIEAVFGLTREEWEDAAVIRSLGASAYELVVIQLPDEDAAIRMEDVFSDYLPARQSAFAGYAPFEAEMAANGKIVREGRTVGLFICPDPEGAAEAFTAAYNGETLLLRTEPEPKPLAEADIFTPAFPIHDLLFRMLIEALCPDWREMDNKSWTDGCEIGEVMFGIAQDQYQDFAVAMWEPSGDGTVDGEISKYVLAIFLTDSEEGAAELVEILEGYWENENARAVQAGHYAAWVVSDLVEDAVLLFPRAVADPETKGFFERYINENQIIADPDPDYPDRVRFDPPGEDDMSIYDTSDILTAWEKNDASGLTDDDRDIYDAAEKLLAEIIADEMTGLEKETAVYQWIVDNVNYDWSHQDALAETDRRSYGPYGGLVNRQAVCLGYAATFQLLMDMCGVECITVVGAAFNNTGDHAWNMVRLDGDWYCVDVTWDANARELQNISEWRYFNVTSGEMAKSHQWDYASIPETAIAA